MMEEERRSSFILPHSSLSPPNEKNPAEIYRRGISAMGVLRMMLLLFGGERQTRTVDLTGMNRLL